jgi:hypothetical protein
MKKNKLYRHLVLSIALLLPAHSILCISPAATPQTPIEVIVIGQPESALSKESAALVKFFMDGIRSTWNRYCAIQDNEAQLVQGSRADKANAVLSAALRGVMLATPPLVGLLLLEGTKIGLE